MNIRKSIYTFILPLTVLCACDSDLEQTTYDPTQNTPAVLQELNSSYVLDSKKAQETAIEFKWSSPTVNYPAAITTQLQMDLAGKNFEGEAMKLVASTMTDESYAIKTADLNNLLQSIIKTYGITEESLTVEFRLSSTVSTTAEPFLSNVVSTTITPYSADIQYPEIYAVGDYSSWGWDTAQSLFSFSEDEVNYEGLIDFGDKAANGFKFTGDKSWDNGNWGTDGSAAAPAPEATSVQLIDDSGSGNISCYSKRFYRFTFNKEDLILKMNMGFNAFYLVGSDPGMGWNTETGIEMNFDPEKQCFYVDYEFAGDAEIKFLTDTETWFGGDANGGLNTQDNIKVSAGNYRIYVNLNNSSNQTYELNTDDFGK